MAAMQTVDKHVGAHGRSSCARGGGEGHFFRVMLILVLTSTPGGRSPDGVSPAPSDKQVSHSMPPSPPWASLPSTPRSSMRASPPGSRSSCSSHRRTPPPLPPLPAGPASPAPQ
eukprot:364936-Chlamydomonas_euryale.AAC.1